MAIEDYVAQFGKRGTGNPGGGIGYGLQAQQMRNQNQRYEQQRAQQEQMAKLQEQRDYIRSGVEAIQSVPANQRQFVYQGMMAEAARRGYDVADEPTEWSDEMLPRLMGAAGVAAPKSQVDRIGAYNPRDYTPESFARFRQTGDDSVLQRYAPSQTVTSGGVTYAFDPVSDSFKPLREAEKVAKDVATIKGAETTAQQKAKQDVERASPEAIQKQQQQISAAEAEIGELGRASQIVTDMINHPGRKAATGGSSILPTRPGSEAADFESKLEQLRGLAFLIQREKLKGTGTVTDFESSKAESALAALNTSMSEGAFLKELNDIKDVFDTVQQRKRQQLNSMSGSQQGNGRPGWQLMIDANGNRAYVGPNGEIEEL